MRQARQALIACALVVLLAGCSKSPELVLRLSNPSADMEVSDIQVLLNGQSLTGAMKLTLGPLGYREYRGLQAAPGELQLSYRYADSETPSQFTSDLATRFGPEYSGTIQITFLSGGDVDVSEAAD
jgi:hypothetical protein